MFLFKSWIFLEEGKENKFSNQISETNVIM